MVKNRYFPKYEELRKLFEKTDFVNVKDCYEIIYELTTIERIEELVSKDRKVIIEQKGNISEEDEKKLQELGQERAKELAQYVRERIPENMRARINFQDFGDDVRFQIRKVIMMGFCGN